MKSGAPAYKSIAIEAAFWLLVATLVICAYIKIAIIFTFKAGFPLARFVLSRIDPERAHRFVVAALKCIPNDHLVGLKSELGSLTRADG